MGSTPQKISLRSKKSCVWFWSDMTWSQLIGVLIDTSDACQCSGRKLKNSFGKIAASQFETLIKSFTSPNIQQDTFPPLLIYIVQHLSTTATKWKSNLRQQNGKNCTTTTKLIFSARRQQHGTNLSTTATKWRKKFTRPQQNGNNIWANKMEKNWTQRQQNCRS